MMLSSHKSGVVYNNKTIYHSLVVHELVANSVLLDYLKYCFNCFRLVSLSNIWITKHLPKYHTYNFSKSILNKEMCV